MRFLKENHNITIVASREGERALSNELITFVKVIRGQNLELNGLRRGIASLGTSQDS